MRGALLALAACTSAPPGIVEPDRAGGFFDRPFPSDELRTSDGTLDLADFPMPDSALGETMVGGWARMAGESAHGFSHLGPILFRLSAAVEADAAYPGGPRDDVRLFSLDSDHRVPVRVRVVTSDEDPFYAGPSLVLAPDPRHALRSGERYAAVLDRRLVGRPDGYEPPPELDGEPGVGVATVFTVQDSLGELRALGAATDAALDAHPDWLVPDGLREVRRLAFAQTTTPSGEATTALTVTYADGGTSVTWLAERPEQADFEVDLTDDPTTVYEATIRTVSWRPLEGRPWATPGVGFLSDFGRSDGAIPFDADAALLAEPEPEPMRVVVVVPKGGPLRAVATWDHGTAGNAYDVVQHAGSARRNAEIRASAAAAGVVLVGRDQPLYGARFPLIDRGFDASLGFYNIANLPAFRDNQRQGAVDHRVLFRFVTEALPDALPETAPATTNVGAFGHSLGSVTAHLGLVMQGGAGARTALMSGSGGFLTHYVTDTGLLGTDNDVVTLLEGFVDADLPDDPTGSEAVGALLGVDEDAWSTVDDLHPVFALFQTLMDPSDPLSLAAHQPVPETFVVGAGDWQVPNLTTGWLVDALPDARRVECVPRSDYDPHHCTFTEDEGLDAMAAWFEALAATP
jgi:hypothetical protein